MLKYFIILTLILLPVAVFSQTPNCYKFKEGKFRIADTKAGVVTIADRNSQYQTETSEALKAVVRFKITWQSNCSYTLKLDKVLRNDNKINFPTNMEIKATIISTSENSYTQEISSSLANKPYKVVVTKIN